VSISQLPIIIPFVFLAWALLIPLVGLWKNRFAQPLAVLGAGISSGFSVYGFITHIGMDPIRYRFGGWEPPIGIEFVYDGLSSFVVMVINVVGFFVLMHSKHLSKIELSGKEMPFFSLAMLMMLGLNGIVLTGDLFNLFVFLEISSLSAYALLSIGRPAAPFAAFRYLIIGTVGGSLYLLGVGFLYTVTGTLNIIDMKAMLPQFASQPAVVTGLILITVGMGIKAALYPMHGWLPDVYTNANSTASALVAPIGTKVAAYVLIRILLLMFGIELMDAVVPLSTIIGVLASVGIIYGSVLAIRQTDLKRMLAYSSVSQIGYILLGLSLANPIGFVGAVLHVLNHAVMKGCLFLVSGNIQFREGHTDVSRFDKSYSKKYPWTMLSFTIAAISMIGLPPLAGFFSKWYLAMGTVENGDWIFLAVILVSSLLNAVYFFRIIEKVYLAKSDVDAEYNEVPASMLIPTLVLGIALLVIGLANAWIVSTILPLYG
jgi:multicomponent Na+:H+ antiporter subunit D